MVDREVVKKPTKNQVPLAPLFTMLALTLLACGCHKSPREIAEENAIKRHEQEVSHRGPSREWISNYLRTPEGMRFGSEGGFLMSLLTNGQLPGVSKDRKGYFRFEKKVAGLTSDGGCSNEVHFLTLENPADNYYYVISQDSSNSPWQMRKAWHTDQSSNIIQEFPVQ